MRHSAVLEPLVKSGPPPSGSSHLKQSAQFGRQGRSSTRSRSSFCRDTLGLKKPPLSAFQPSLLSLCPHPCPALTHCSFLGSLGMGGSSLCRIPPACRFPSWQTFRFWTVLSRGNLCFPARGCGQHLHPQSPPS